MAQLSVAAAVATRDRPGSLGRLIDSLLAQSRRPDEILIIDDGKLPDDRLADWQSRCQSAGVKWVYQRKDRPGRSASRNLAARLTACDTVCFLDDDCEPTPSFLARMLDGLTTLGRWQIQEQGGNARPPSAPFVAIEPLVIPPGGCKVGDRVFKALLRLSGWWMLARVAELKTRKLGDRVAGRGVLGGVCLVYRDALAATPFDESLAHGEDNEWSVRLARLRFASPWQARLPMLGRLGCATDAVCLHHVDPTGRPGAVGVGVRLARSYVYSQGKLFGWRGTALAFVTLTAMAAGEFVLGLVGCAALRKSGPGFLALAIGTIGGMFSPTGRRADE